MPDSQAPGDRFAVKAKDYCVDTANAPVVVANLSMHACTFSVRNCTGCKLHGLNITYPSYHREIHLRDPQPFRNGPPPNTTHFEADDSTITQLAIRYSNSAGLKIVGSNNVVKELLILDTDWLGTLDYPPLELGFAATVQTPPNGSHGLTMYPRATHGLNNTVTRATIGRFGNAGIVTSQLSNEVSYAHVFEGGLIGKDTSCVHADNSRCKCMNAVDKADCGKYWHHNWVHDCRGKCVRGDDNTVNLTIHHNVVFNCGVGPGGADGMGQSFGVILKGNYNAFWANTVLRTGAADVCLPTTTEGQYARGCAALLLAQHIPATYKVVS